MNSPKRNNQNRASRRFREKIQNAKDKKLKKRDNQNQVSRGFGERIQNTKDKKLKKRNNQNQVSRVFRERIQNAKDNKLKGLDLSNNFASRDDEKLTEIPIEVWELEQLEVLNLSFNQLKNIPESITKLTNLTRLDLSGNQLTSIPKSITKLTKLTQLDLRDNQLTSIPESITKLTNLIQLCLSRNKLTSIPESITKLTNLIQLYLSNNKLTSIPESINELNKLTLLDLSNNQLTSILESITKLTKLTLLDLRDNQLTSIPESITKLTKLNQLYLSTNQLTSIPESINELTKLNQLYLSTNQLTSIPESITKLSNLTQLDLSHNQLTSIPESITKLSNLTRLSLSFNPLETPPIEIAEKGIEAIREYFQQIKEEGTDYLYEAKLLIIGEAGAGKTTLANKIQNPNYQLRDEDTTKGIEVHQWNFPIKNQQNFQMNIWDFGGQEIYHATHQFFLTKRSLYILVADTRKEDTDFYYWLNVVELLSDNSPLLIVKNEKQDRKREINQRELQGQFTNIEKILDTNLAKNRNLEKIRTEIQHYITNLPHVGNALPKTWKKVREALELNSRNYISLTEYLSICEQNGFKKHEDKLQLSDYLHDLGVCLHFRDDPLLNKTVILKPEWGTAAVYKALDNPKVYNNFGKFTKDDLTDIWHESKYANMHDELLQLMIKFQLCYKIPDNSNTYIAPQLLTAAKPGYDWDENNSLILRYTYEFMPKGIITQFIVAMHKDIEEQKYVWKRGVILKKNQARAEVIEYYGKREIKIRISGQQKRDLMTIVTHELDKIHSSYNNRLKYNKLIPCNCAGCKNIQNPYFYNFRELKERIDYHKYTIECGRPPYNEINVLSLIDDVIDRGRDKEFFPPREDFTEVENSPQPKSSNQKSRGIIFQSPVNQVIIPESQTGNNISEETMTKERVIEVGGDAKISASGDAKISMIDNIENSFNTLAEAKVDDDIKNLLDQLLNAIHEVNKKATPEQVETVEIMAQDAETLVKESTKTQPRRKWYEMSLEGVKDAAKNMGEIAVPVLKVVDKITPLLLP